MNKWVKIIMVCLGIFLILSILLNLSLTGYLPSQYFPKAIDKEETSHISSQLQSNASENGRQFEGTKSDAYYMCVFRQNADYWKGVYKGFKAAGDQLGVRTVYSGCDEYDANAQLLIFEQIIAKKPKGIALSPITPEIFKEPINRAVAAGIKVTCFASDSPDSKRSMLVSSDNFQEAIASADFIAKDLGGKGEIGIIERPYQSNHAKRVQAFIEKLAQSYPDIKVVARKTAEGDEAKAARIAVTMIKENPNLNYIYCVAGMEGRGAGVGVKETGKKVKVFCFDADPPVIDMLKEGSIFAVIQPNAVNQGYWSMLGLFVETHNLIDPVSDWRKTGKSPLPNMIDNGFDFVTKENGDYFYVR